jgi:hypothetical protein
MFTMFLINFFKVFNTSFNNANSSSLDSYSSKIFINNNNNLNSKNNASSSFFKRSMISNNNATTITGKSSNLKRDVGIKLLDAHEQSATPKEAKRKRKEQEKETIKKQKSEQIEKDKNEKLKSQLPIIPIISPLTLSSTNNTLKNENSQKEFQLSEQEVTNAFSESTEQSPDNLIKTEFNYRLELKNQNININDSFMQNDSEKNNAANIIQHQHKNNIFLQQQSEQQYQYLPLSIPHKRNLNSQTAFTEMTHNEQEHQTETIPGSEFSSFQNSGFQQTSFTDHSFMGISSDQNKQFQLQAIKNNSSILNNFSLTNNNNNNNNNNNTFQLDTINSNNHVFNTNSIIQDSTLPSSSLTASNVSSSEDHNSKIKQQTQQSQSLSLTVHLFILT